MMKCSFRICQRLVSSFVAILAIGWCVDARAGEGARPSPTLLQAISHARALVRDQMAPKVPGMSVAIGIDGVVVWSEGFGFKDLAEKIPVSSSTKFRIGSVSKSLTSAGLALLAERGKLDLDAPIQTYVPDFPQKDGTITTRLLGGHLAGI